MNKKTFKIFKNSTRDLQFVEYDTNIPYYSYLKKQNSLGLNQFLFTSNLMILMALSLIKNQSEIIDVDLYDSSDDEATKRFISLFKRFADKVISEDDLHKHLNYLEYEFSIDIVALKFRNERLGTLTLKSNGIMVMSGEINQWQDLVLSLLLKNWAK
jgi:hypothetical protein